MKKIILTAIAMSIVSSYAFAVDHTNHTDHAKSDINSATKQEKKMSCMDKKGEGEMIMLSKSIAEDIVEEQILPKLKGFSLVKTEKNDQGYDVYLKDSSGNNFKISLKGHIISSGLNPVRQ